MPLAVQPNPRSQPPSVFFSRLSQACVAYPRATLGVLLLLTLLGVAGLFRLREEEDILVFLPGGDADVAVFKDVARRFGALRVALLGVEPPAGKELFSAEMLGRLQHLSAALKNTSGVDRVVSLSTMTDLDVGLGGVDVRPLVPAPIPADAGALARLRQHALGLPQVRGTIVSADGKAALVMVFLVEGANTRRVAEQVKRVARRELGGCRIYYGGAPFAGQAIYDATQQDVRRLTPLSILIFFIIVLVSFHDWLAVVLTVGTVGLAGILIVGGMGLWGEPFTVITSILPVVLFAAGSQYAIHVLGRYYLLRARRPAPAAAMEAVGITGPPVTIAAATTALGFLSFLVMNIRPMRGFGLACAIGIGFCWLLSLTLVPVVVGRLPRPQQRPAHLSFVEDCMEGLWNLVQRWRLPVLGLAAVLLVVFARFASEVTVRMEPRAFFQPGSEPARAEAFLNSRFGGSQFVQVAVEGDLLHPQALRELRRLSVYARALPQVTQVQSILDPLTLVREAMGGGHGLPQSREQVGNLLFFLEGEPSVRTLLSGDRQSALLHVRVQGEPKAAIAGLERYLDQRWPFKLRAPSLEEQAEEIGWSLNVSAAELKARRPAILQALQKIAPLSLSEGAPDAEVVADEQERREAELRKKATERVLAAAGASGSAEARGAVEAVVSDLLFPPAGAKVEAAGDGMRGRLSGEPILDRGFSRAVDQNQWMSLSVALLAVFVLLLVALRSVIGSILCIVPAGLALAVVLGALGALGQPIDIGTSLVGSIVTGSGSDFAMHYIWYLRQMRPREVARTVGPVVLTTALLLAAGLGVLALGASPPIRLFGVLAAAGLLLSSGFTFLLVPALLPRLSAEREKHEFG